MNVEKKNRFPFLAILVCLVTVLTGCRTTPVPDLDSLEYQRRIATLEARVVDYERRLAEYDNLVGGTIQRLEVIRSRADGITDRVDRLIFLFEEYDREVNRLIDSFNSAGGSISQEQKDELLALVRFYCDDSFESWQDYIGLRQTVVQ
jgi:hypothetical protein